MTAVAKERKNREQGYAFRGIEDLYNSLHPIFADVGVFAVPELIEHWREPRLTKSGNTMMYTLARIRFTFYSAEDGSSFSAVTLGEGADVGDKSSNKAMSNAHKYALLQILTIPTEDIEDPDADTPDPSKLPETGDPIADAPKDKTSPPADVKQKAPPVLTGAQYVAKISALIRKNGVAPETIAAFIRKCYPREDMKNLSPRAANEIIEFLERDNMTDAKVKAETERAQKG